MATIDLLPFGMSRFGMSRSYEELVDRSAELFVADDRVFALFVVGSVGRGAADAPPDLDLLLVTADGDT